MVWLLQLQNTLKRIGQTGAPGELTQELPEDYFKHFRDLAQSMQLDAAPATVTEPSLAPSEAEHGDDDDDDIVIAAGQDDSATAAPYQQQLMMPPTLASEDDDDSPVEKALFSPLQSRSPVTTDPSPLDAPASMQSTTVVADEPRHVDARRGQGHMRKPSASQLRSAFLAPTSFGGSPRELGSDETVAVPLTAFYPPLPSYDVDGGDESNDRSPSFFPQVDRSIEIQDIRVDVHRGQMSVDAQLFLHSTSQGSDPTTSEGEAADPSSQPSSTPKLNIPRFAIAYRRHFYS
jgi:hypothetical protein